MSTEFGDEKTCFYPSAASAGRFPRMVRDIKVVARPLAPLGASPLDAPGSIILEDLESVSTTLFAAPAWIIRFVALKSCFRVHVSTSTSTVFSAGLQEQSVQEELTPFRSSPTAFRLLSHTLTPINIFYTSVTAPCSAGVHKATVHICMQKPRSQSSWLGLPSPLRSLCCAIHPLSRLHRALLRKPRNSILLASSNFILLHPGTQHHRVTPPIVRLTLMPLALTSPHGLAG